MVTQSIDIDAGRVSSNWLVLLPANWVLNNLSAPHEWLAYLLRIPEVRAPNKSASRKPDATLCENEK